ncbi:hypothetical protein BJV82DRAFT_602053 [Fennellomyces sp. T-0311]|nr:hypothetical protein BJV82DRAFT_602053 [Fennellomyces sp. T-0311]
MKRLNEHDASDSNKKPRFSQASYGDMYSQYSAMNPAAMMMNSQYGGGSPFAQSSAGANGFGSFPSNGMYMGGYGVPGSNMGFGGGFGPSGYPAAMAAAAAAAMTPNGQQQEVSRTIYFGNVPKDIKFSDIFDTVHTGPVESLKILLEKNCAFLSFVDPASAQQYYQEYLTKKLTIKESEIKVGWGKYAPREQAVQTALQNGGSRCVYVGNIVESITEETLREDLSKYGTIEHVRIVREKNYAFVHFTSIVQATKCVMELPLDDKYAKRKINYGKDRCGYTAADPSAQPQQAPQQQQPQQQPNQYAFNFQHPFRGAPFNAYNPSGSSAPIQGNYSQDTTAMRTIYLGNISSEATCEDLCNAIRGGVLFQIRYLADKHIAFVTFVDPMSAMNVFNYATVNGIVVKSRRLRVGWGKPAGVHPSVIIAVQNGASRNIYIGNIEDTFDENKLRKDFEEYGEIELINTLRERNCAFVNFTCITSAMKALAAMKNHPDYKKYRVNYGKDRCGNPFKRPPQHQQQQNGGSEMAGHVEN